MYFLSYHHFNGNLSIIVNDCKCLFNCCFSKGKHESDVNSSSPLSPCLSKALMMSFRQFPPYVPTLQVTCDLPLSSLSTLTGQKSDPPPSLTPFSPASARVSVHNSVKGRTVGTTGKNNAPTPTCSF